MTSSSHPKLRLLLLLTFCQLVLIAVQTAARCRNKGDVFFGDVCYRFVQSTQPVTFPAASDYCSRLGDNKTLAIISTKRHQLFLANYLESRGWKDALIGLKLIITPWHWVPPLLGEESGNWQSPQRRPIPKLLAGQGCYLNSRVDASNSMYSRELTVGGCIKFCHEKSKNFAGVQAATVCHCADTLPPLNSATVNCSLKCSGDSNQLCGNNRAAYFYNADPADSSVYDNWAPSKPGIDGGCGATMVVDKHHAAWVDVTCSTPLSFICQFPRLPWSRADFFMWRLNTTVTTRKEKGYCTKTHCYLVFPRVQLDFASANKFCSKRARGGHLVHIVSPEEQIVVNRLVLAPLASMPTFRRPIPSATFAFWIGATNREFQWVTGEPLRPGYAAWAADTEPAVTGVYKCVRMSSFEGSYTWKTRSCESVRGSTGFICSGPSIYSRRRISKFGKFPYGPPSNTYRPVNHRYPYRRPRITTETATNWPMEKYRVTIWPPINKAKPTPDRFQSQTLAAKFRRKLNETMFVVFSEDEEVISLGTTVPPSTKKLIPKSISGFMNRPYLSHDEDTTKSTTTRDRIHWIILTEKPPSTGKPNYQTTVRMPTTVLAPPSTANIELITTTTTTTTSQPSSSATTPITTVQPTTTIFPTTTPNQTTTVKPGTTGGPTTMVAPTTIKNKTRNLQDKSEKTAAIISHTPTLKVVNLKTTQSVSASEPVTTTSQGVVSVETTIPVIHYISTTRRVRAKNAQTTAMRWLFTFKPSTTVHITTTSATPVPTTLAPTTTETTNMATDPATQTTAVDTTTGHASTTRPILMWHFEASTAGLSSSTHLATTTLPIPTTTQSPLKMSTKRITRGNDHSTTTAESETTLETTANRLDEKIKAEPFHFKHADYEIDTENVYEFGNESKNESTTAPEKIKPSKTVAAYTSAHLENATVTEDTNKAATAKNMGNNDKHDEEKAYEIKWWHVLCVVGIAVTVTAVAISICYSYSEAIKQCFINRKSLVRRVSPVALGIGSKQVPTTADSCFDVGVNSNSREAKCTKFFQRRRTSSINQPIICTEEQTSPDLPASQRRPSASYRVWPATRIAPIDNHAVFSPVPGSSVVVPEASSRQLKEEAATGSKEILIQAEMVPLQEKKNAQQPMAVAKPEDQPAEKTVAATTVTPPVSANGRTIEILPSKAESEQQPAEVATNKAVPQIAEVVPSVQVGRSNDSSHKPTSSPEAVPESIDTSQGGTDSTQGFFIQLIEDKKQQALTPSGVSKEETYLDKSPSKQLSATETAAIVNTTPPLSPNHQSVDKESNKNNDSPDKEGASPKALLPKAETPTRAKCKSPSPRQKNLESPPSQTSPTRETKS